MQNLGHTWLDVLKVDVEGSEFDVFHHLAALNHGMPFTQLQLEVHFGVNTPYANRQALALLYNLMSRGLRTMSAVRLLVHRCSLYRSCCLM
jgi:hypothetical protein